nr:hypothetical protein [Frankia sp. R43]
MVVDDDDGWVRLCASTLRVTMNRVSFVEEGHGPVGGHIPVRGDATLLSSHAGRTLRSGGLHYGQWPPAATTRWSEPAGHLDSRHRDEPVDRNVAVSDTFVAGSVVV